MGIEFRTGNIFESECETIVNPINCVGVMGKGLALEFKKRYPKMYKDYVARCNANMVKTGQPYLYKSSDKNILNFPTKYHWRNPSKLEYVTKGLDWFVDNYQELGIKSIAFVPLGCGLGGLDWNIVKREMINRLQELPIKIIVYEQP